MNHPHPLRLHLNDKAAVLSMTTVVSKPKKVKCIGPPLTALYPAFGSKPAELYQLGLILMKSKPELGKTPLKVGQYLPPVLFVLKA